MSIFRGIGNVSVTYKTLPSPGHYLPDSLSNFMTYEPWPYVQPVPMMAMVLCAAVGAFYLSLMVAGRENYAVGGNEEAAVISGIPVEKVVVGAFSMMGAIVAITGFMQTSYSGASTTTVGDLMELDAIAACVIGGVSLKGGRGTVLGVLFGALIMACLLNGMTLLAVSPEFKFIARGAVLSLAVWMDVRLAR